MQIASFWIPDFLFAAQSNACLYDCWCHFPRGVLVVEVEILLAVDKCPTIRALKSFIAGFRNWSKNAQSIESRKVTDCCCAESGQEVEICPTPDHAWIFLQILPKNPYFPSYDRVFVWDIIQCSMLGSVLNSNLLSLASLHVRWQKMVADSLCINWLFSTTKWPSQ